MDMWCLYGIGREVWDREVLRIVCQHFPLEGEISLTGVFRAATTQTYMYYAALSWKEAFVLCHQYWHTEG